MIFSLAQDFHNAVEAMPREHPERCVSALFHLSLNQESSDLHRFCGGTGAMPFSEQHDQPRSSHEESDTETSVR